MHLESPKVEGFLDELSKTELTAEELMYEWNDYLQYATLGYGELEWQRPSAPSSIIAFKMLMRHTWMFFRDHPLSNLPEDDDPSMAPYETYEVFLNVYSALKAYANSGMQAVRTYDHRLRYLPLMQDRNDWGVRNAYREYIATTIAASGLCKAVASGNSLSSPIVTCELQTFGTTCCPRQFVTAEIGEGQVELMEGERFHTCEFNAETGDLSEIKEMLDSLKFNECFYPW